DQKIEVEGAGAPTLATHAAARRLDGEERVEQGLGRERGGQRRGRVEIILLPGGAERRRLVNRRAGDEPRARQGVERGESRLEMRAAVAEVGAQRDVSGDGEVGREGHGFLGARSTTGGPETGD